MNSIEKRISEKITWISTIADEFPSMVIIHRFHRNSFSIEYMSNRGLDDLKMTMEELKAIGKNFFQCFMNPRDAEDYLPKVFDLLERNDVHEIFTFFHQSRLCQEADWAWHLSSIRILMRDDEGKPLLLITSSVPITPLTHLTRKVSRLLEENTFIRNHYSAYARLTEREKEILMLIAKGKSNKEIAESIFISINTAETHRKNIKAKLNAKSNHELQKYAEAFEH